VAEGRVASINVSPGGVPKRSRRECRIGVDGLEGDGQGDRRHHGGPARAVVLYSLERIESLRREGHPIAPGTIGENLTVSGLEWDDVVPGVQLSVGDVCLELTRFASPCPKIAGSFRDDRFDRVSERVHPGWSRVCAKVLVEGRVRVGDIVHTLPPAEE
jgi:MOSC domain-containing protein YiiM